MTDWIPFRPEAITAFLSFLAAAFAAYATWRAPISAAEHGENLRQRGTKEAHSQQLKFYVFSTLMQERAFLATSDAVKALNLIDVVFHDSREVREAWAELFIAFDRSKSIPNHVTEERQRKLLRAMAHDIGMSDNLRLDDFGRVYYPDAIAQEDHVRRLEREIRLRNLLGQSAPTTEKSPAPKNDIWPPEPE